MKAQWQQAFVTPAGTWLYYPAPWCDWEWVPAQEGRYMLGNFIRKFW